MSMQVFTLAVGPFEANCHILDIGESGPSSLIPAPTPTGFSVASANADCRWSPVCLLTATWITFRRLPICSTPALFPSFCILPMPNGLSDRKTRCFPFIPLPDGPQSST